jgi:hypothetical protein
MKRISTRVITREADYLCCEINGKEREFYPFSPVAGKPYREEGDSWYHAEGWQDNKGLMLVLYWCIGDSCNAEPDEDWREYVRDNGPDYWQVFGDLEEIYL